MPEERELEKQLKLVSKTGKYIVGRREVMSSLKGSKLLVWSASANIPKNLLDESSTLEIPALRFNGNPVELGRACGIPFRVSVIAVKSAGDADLKPFASSKDYGYLSSAPTGITATSTGVQQPEEKGTVGIQPTETSPAKKARKKSSPTKDKEGGDEKSQVATKKRAKRASKKANETEERASDEEFESAEKNGDASKAAKKGKRKESSKTKSSQNRGEGEEEEE